MKGSGAGKLFRYINDEKNVIGAGGYGLVIENTRKKVSKLFFDNDACQAMFYEASIMHDAKKIIETLHYPVKVPSIWEVYDKNVYYKGQKMLCGIQMERVYPPKGYNALFHILCGTEDDVDTYWGKRISEPVCENNPPRGFFASKDSAEELWEKEGFDFNIDKYCALMGAVCGSLLSHGILPIDLEFVYFDRTIWVIDFGLCVRVKKHIDPMEFYLRHSAEGLGTDLYIPHKNMEGYESFLHEYLYWANERNT